MLPRIKTRTIPFTILLLLFGLRAIVHAELRLPHAISNHAVLQRERPIQIWGWATAGSNLRVSFHGQQASATADRLGHWNVWLEPERAGGPYTLTIDGDGHAEVSDLLVGDVWVASGQSNMEFPLKGFDGAPLKNGAAEIATADQPGIRLLLIRKRTSAFPVDDVEDTWTTCTPETATNFSAIAYLFGREISAKEQVPIGLVDTTWGGTPADAWVSMETLGSDANLQPAFAARANFTEPIADFQAMLAAEKRDDDEARAAGRPPAKHAWHPGVEQSFAPAALYNGMVAPLTPMQIRGFLWYQGETNGQPARAPFYRTLFPALIEDWRMQFAQGSLPFLFVQISSFQTTEEWGLVRDAQRRTLALRDTAMAVSLDAGEHDNVHPADKQTVAARLALAARGMVYGQANTQYAPPLFREAAIQGSSIRVWFDHAAGLTTRGAPAGDFEIAGADGKFLAAEARLEGETVVVSAPATPQPRFVRYAWNPVVSHFLYNAAGLPMSTFTSQPLPNQ